LKLVSLNRNGDFRRLYYRGKSFVSPVLVTYLLRNRVGSTRVGITASKKIGKAVERNRSRRVIREAYRTLYPLLPSGYDFVFVARSRTGRSKMAEVLSAMKKHLTSAGILS